MSVFANDPDYELRWPRSLFGEELDRLIALAEFEGVDWQWEAQVEALLRQAFGGSEPLEAFRRSGDMAVRRSSLDEEPF